MVVAILFAGIQGVVYGENSLNLEEPNAKNLAFPKKKAGFGCWAKLSSQPDISKVGELLTQVEEVGDNYLYGYLYLEKYTRTKVYVYADANGYLVTFLDKETAPARIIDWDYVNFKKQSIEYFTITRVMADVFNKLNVSTNNFMEKIDFADFQYPEANKFALGIIHSDEKKEEYLHIAPPKKKAEIYSWSYNLGGRHYYYYHKDDTYNFQYASVLYLDEEKYASTKKGPGTPQNKDRTPADNIKAKVDSGFLWKKGSKKEVKFDYDKPHSFKLDYHFNDEYRNKSKTWPKFRGLAVVVIYSQSN